VDNIILTRDRRDQQILIRCLTKESEVVDPGKRMFIFHKNYTSFAEGNSMTACKPVCNPIDPRLKLLSTPCKKAHTT